MKAILDWKDKAVLIKQNPHELYFGIIFNTGDEYHIGEYMAFDPYIHHGSLDLINIIFCLIINNSCKSGLQTQQGLTLFFMLQSFVVALTDLLILIYCNL